jgi:hypothetical protein
MPEAHIDKRASNRAEQLIKEALRVLMQGTAILPADQECPRSRAEIGVRTIAGVLWELSAGYELAPDLKAVLWAVSNGSEPRHSGWLRWGWQSVHDVPENVQ